VEVSEGWKTVCIVWGHVDVLDNWTCEVAVEVIGVALAMVFLKLVG